MIQKKILIIGSKGFIGSHCLQYFKSKPQNYKVWSSDVMVDYIEPNYFLLDSSKTDFKFIFEKEDFDFCINCAGAASVADSIANPLRDFELNVSLVFKILDGIRQYAPNCKFINLSSAAVYGNPSSLPILESTNIAPVSPYGKHKRMAEDICSEFYQHFGIGTCSLRIFSAYGEGLKKQLFWDLNTKKTNSNQLEAFKIFGTGNESRDFIYINDLVKCIALVLTKCKFESDTLNIANGQEIYIKDAVETFYGQFNETIHYEFSGDKRPGDPVNWVADISKIRAIGYQPEFNLKEGLLNYIKWIQEIEKQ